MPRIIITLPDDTPLTPADLERLRAALAATVEQRLAIARAAEQRRAWVAERFPAQGREEATP